MAFIDETNPPVPQLIPMGNGLTLDLVDVRIERLGPDGGFPRPTPAQYAALSPVEKELLAQWQRTGELPTVEDGVRLSANCIVARCREILARDARAIRRARRLARRIKEES